MKWNKRPMIYEINTWVWIDELSVKYGRPMTLGTLPAAEWDALAGLAMDAVWFMGVWERSPIGIGVANRNPGLQEDFHKALPDYTAADNVGSAYCVKNYVVDAHLGGPEGLAKARKELASRGVRLILDYVPNHIAPDHPWVMEHPEYLIQGTAEDLQRAPAEFFEANGHVIANGRDPYFAPWPDVAQLNAFDPRMRAGVIETVNAIADQCDGMRCDMGMLLISDVFARTWGARAGERPATEYWQEIIPAVRAAHPDVLFIAEAYWDLEWQLIQQGFDYCYDKRLYDRLEAENAQSVHGHLQADVAYQGHLLRFIENHDEPRAAATFDPQRERAAAVTTTTLPGAKLVYDGEFEGRRKRLPVFLARRAVETPDHDLVSFYRALLKAVRLPALQEGEWNLCDEWGWADNSTFQNLVSWTWRSAEQRVLIVVNLSAQRSQGMVKLPWTDLGGKVWRLTDVLNNDLFLRDGNQLSDGMYVDLDAWRYHFMKFEN